MSVIRDVCVIWKTLVVILTPLLALPILLHDGSKEMACLYGIVIIACLWITEALPIPITALSPIVIFSLLGVLPSKAVASSYVKDTLLFSISCLSVAVCVEKWRLHRRIALNTLLLVGSSPKWLMLGSMLPTWLLSMVINNTSATAMMIPVVSAVLDNLKEVKASVGGSDVEEKKEDTGNDVDGTDSVNRKEVKNGAVDGTGRNDVESMTKHKDDKFSNLCKSLNICVCYAATLGGIASVTGTSTNLIMQGQADEFFSLYGLDSEVNFLTWMMCCLPISVMCMLVAWAWLIVLFLGVKELFSCDCGTVRERESTKKVIKTFLKELGPMSFAEKAVSVHLFVLLSLWLTIKLPGGSGWSNFFLPGYVKNSAPGIIVLASLFVFPSKRPSGNAGDPKTPIPPLLDWKTTQEKTAWGSILLIGGGYAVANACQESGLSAWIGIQLSQLSNFEPWVMILILSICISFITEITSNAATSSLLCPILIQMAVSMHVNPLYFLFPGALACSLAFMLPVATPPNAIVFAAGNIRIVDMMKAGFALNFLCVAIVNVGINVWGKRMFDLDTFPPEMLSKPGQTVPTDASYYAFTANTTDAMSGFHAMDTTSPAMNYTVM